MILGVGSDHPSCGKSHVGADPNIVPYSGLPPEDQMIPGLGASADRCLRGNQCLFAERDVVGNLNLVVDLAEMGAFPARSVYKAIQEFRNPRHEEFKGGSLWTLYNGVTEHLKGGDLSKLPQRTMTTQSIFDKIAGHAPEIVEVEAEAVELPA